MRSKFLFLTTPQNRAFSDVLADVVLPYGALEVATWQNKPKISEYEFIFLDAGVLAELDNPNSLSGVIEQIKSDHPQAHVLVTTSSATWKRTREALLAGAVDYVRQTLDPDSLRNNLMPTLDKYLLKT